MNKEKGMPIYQYEIASDRQARIHFYSDKTDVKGIMQDAVSHYTKLFKDPKRSVSLLIFDSKNNQICSFGIDLASTTTNDQQ